MLLTTFWTAFPLHLGNVVSILAGFSCPAWQVVGCTWAPGWVAGCPRERESGVCTLKPLREAFPLLVGHARPLALHRDRQRRTFGNCLATLSQPAGTAGGEVGEAAAPIPRALFVSDPDHGVLLFHCPLQPSRGPHAPSIGIWGISPPRWAWLGIFCLQEVGFLRPILVQGEFLTKN